MLPDSICRKRVATLAFLPPCSSQSLIEAGSGRKIHKGMARVCMSAVHRILGHFMPNACCMSWSRIYPSPRRALPTPDNNARYVGFGAKVATCSSTSTQMQHPSEWTASGILTHTCIRPRPSVTNKIPTLTRNRVLTAASRQHHGYQPLTGMSATRLTLSIKKSMTTTTLYNDTLEDKVSIHPWKLPKFLVLRKYR